MVIAITQQRESSSGLEIKTRTKTQQRNSQELSESCLCPEACDSVWTRLRLPPETHRPTHRMGFRVNLLLLALAVVVVSGQRKRPVNKEWNYRDGSEKVSMRGVANLTQVLDDWRFDILSQMKNLLQNDHQTLLPDYSRIQPLSEALDDLYKEFNALKAHLGELTEKFTAIETFIDELKAEKANAAPPAAPVTPLRRRVLKTRPQAS